MMVGCGLRNGEARAVNSNNVVADDVYRVHEQIHSNTHKVRGEARHDEGGYLLRTRLVTGYRSAT
jgi:hypothetical protein